MRTTGNREQGSGNGVRMLTKLGALGAMAAVLLLAGCRQDMQDQPKFFPQRGTSFYADGRSVRPQVENTVARGQLHEDTYFYTGLVNGKEGDATAVPGDDGGAASAGRSATTSTARRATRAWAMARE